MPARCVLLLAMLVGLGCNAGDRDSQAMSGSAGLSAGGGPQTSGIPGSSSGAIDSTSGAWGSTGSGNDSPGSSGPSETGDTVDASTTGATESAGTSTGNDTTGGGSDSSSGGESDTSGIVDGVLDIGIIAHNDCTFTVEPSSITVPEGTEFTVNWISSPASEVEFDIAKIDPFNHVPIVIGMTPGYTHHDDVRVWCGNLFTGTFDFRLTSCFDPLYIPVDCGG